MTLSNYERETIILYNQEGPNAICNTYDRSLIRRLDALARENEAITVLREGDGWKEYQFPKKWVKVRAPRKLSDEQRQELAERMKSTMRKEHDDEMA